MKPKALYLLTLLLVTIVGVTSATAQNINTKSFPVPFGPTNVGTDFYFSFPANWDYAAAFKYCRLYITSGVETKVKVWAGPTLVKTVTTVPNDIVTVDLSPIQAQIFVRDDRSPIQDDQVYRKKAVHVEAEDPIVVYGINRIQFTSDGFLALPNNALGREYVVSSARDITGGFQKLPSQYMIIAPYDGTTVSIVNSMDTPNHLGGRSTTITMNEGDVYSALSADGSGGDLSGTLITSSKPVAVTAGQNCTYLPNYTYPACDHLSEMMLPVSSWGKIYHAVPFANRTKGDMFRIYAGDPNATVFVNGVPITTIARKGGEQGIGWIEYLPIESKPYEFVSNKRIYVAQYNNSQTYDNATQTDPFFLVLTPVEQYQTDLVFCTPGQDYGINFVNIVSDSAGYYNIEIAKGGSEQWEKLHLKQPSIVKKFLTTIDGKTMVGTQFSILPGTYRLRGTTPFAGYIYGFNNFDSYGYPLSAAVGDISTNDSIAPFITKKQDCFGNVEAEVTDFPDEDTIRTNLNSVTLDTKASFNYILTVTKFTPGITRSTTYKLRVRDPRIDAQAVVIAFDGRGNGTRDTVKYSAFNVVFDPEIADFQSLFSGSTRTRIIKIINLSTRPIDITETLLKDGTKGFKILRPTSPFKLGPTGSGTDTMEAEVEFTATTAGNFEDSLGVRDPCGLRFLGLVRANVGTPVIEVTDKNFGQWPVTAGAVNGSIEVRNNSIDGGTLIVTGVAKDITDKVTFTLPDGMPFSFPLTLTAGGARQINVAFDPELEQAYIDSLVFNHNAPPNPANDSIGILQGVGIKASLIATSYDWGRRRVGSGPYDTTVTLRNLGSSDVIIRGILSETGDRSDFQVLNPTVLNKTLGPNETIDVQVRFTPTADGPRKLTIDYDHDPKQANPVISVLDGIGTHPDLATYDYDFGTMLVGATPVILTPIVFKLPAPQSPDWIDSVTITNFVFEPGSSSDFRMDFSNLTLPVVLKRGTLDSVSFTGHFGAQAVGPRSASVRAVTNDGVDRISNWTGVGFQQGTGISGQPYAFGDVCAQGELTRDITNIGQLDITINRMSLRGLTGDFTIVSPDPNTPFVLAPGQTRSVTIRFTPSASAVYSGFLDVENTSSTPMLSLDVSGRGISQTVGTVVTLDGTGGGNRGELGREIMAHISLKDAIRADLNVKSYTVVVTYNPNQLQPNKGAIKLGSANPNAGVVVDPSSTDGRLVLVVSGNEQITTAGELVTVPFGVLFSTVLKDTVDASATTTDVTCLTITPSTASIDIVPICGLSLRLIEMTGTTYALQQNSPNPFNPVTKIEYSLGLDGRTQMLLNDASGKLVQVLFDEHQQPGRYEMTLDVSDLPSGMYYYTLVSGAWKQTRMLTVVK